ncbi:MAG: uroporphyrinogen decarboxylase family protein [Lentisphaeria bacterium]
MDKMTGRERIARILKRQPVDRIGLYEHFWGDTQKAWTAQGHLQPGENLDDHFGFDMSLCWPFNCTADLDHQPEILEEDAETVLTKDGNYAVLRRHKRHDTTPEHVDFTVKERLAWEELVKPRLLDTRDDRRRIDFAAYRQAKAHAAAKGRFFCWSGVNVFELMHPVCGHEHLLAGMALDPDWIRDMAQTYAELSLRLMATLFAEEGLPDGVWYYEDMGYKDHPFMSPAMYEGIIQPWHRRTFDFCHARGLPVIVHSCGFVEPLLPGLVEAGMDALQVMEVKAGMDCRRLKRQYGDRLAFIGGIDVRKLYTNDLRQVEQELRDRVPEMMRGGGYVLHSDHSIPKTVEYATYREFIRRGLELGTY